ncbi:MAG TPA: methylenetetrahydrofolate reductase [Steroidobacteraceae bacterium]
MDPELRTAAAAARTGGAVDTDLKNRLIDFVRASSIEVTPHDGDVLASLVGRLPAGTAVYVTHTPSATIADVAEIACTVENLGFKAFPHIVARRIESEMALVTALDRLRDAGITRAMLVAGDLSTPAGLFASTLDLLDSGTLVAAGVDSIGIAGHPEGHKRIGSTLLWKSLQQKQDYAELTGARVHIVSQFGFNPGALVDWERQLTEHGITLPVHVGIAGPASLRTLIKYAMLCGIGASLNALMTNLSAINSVKHLVTSADEMLVQIVRMREGALARRIVQPHFFSFGGVLQTVRWLESVRAGRFDVDP